MAEKVTFADIAKYTGFSKTTVSRYFNNPDSLTLENQEKISDALKVLGYKENKLAKVLANGKTEMVGVIVPNLYLHYFSEMLNQIISTYEQYGYKFIVFAGNDDKEIERKYISELLAYKIEGLIILSHTISSEELKKYDIPLVTIEREDKYVFSVNSDNYMGGVQAASLLVKSGCDMLIHINDDLDPAMPAYGRIGGFENFCKENKIKYRVILKKLGSTFEDNSKVITKIFDEIEKKYADKKVGIFMPNDTLANILLNLIIRKYGEFPDKYSLVGYDDSPVSKEAVIPISTVGQQIDVIAKEAMGLLVMQMDKRKKRRPEPQGEPVHKVVTPVLIRRETSI